MSLLQRLRNLWRISEWDIPEKSDESVVGTKFTNLFKPPEKVTILKKPLNLQDLIKKTDE